MPQFRIFNGIDISEMQGEVNFNQIANSGVEMVYLRAGGGPNVTDYLFERNYRLAKEARLKQGAYFDLNAKDTAEAVRQADFFYSLIADKELDAYPAMKFEQHNSLTKEQVNAIASGFLDTLQAHLGYTPAVYATVDHTLPLWDEALSAFPLWVAQYGVWMPEAEGVWNTWDGFQYSDIGRVPGISGNVNLNLFKDSMLIHKEAGNNAPIYVVRRGDSLWNIAKRFGVTVADLASWNRIQNPSLIYPGQILLIPQTASFLVYRVKKGDTLWMLAQEFSTTVSKIAAVNGISNPDELYVGQLLFIPI